MNSACWRSERVCEGFSSSCCSRWLGGSVRGGEECRERLSGLEPRQPLTTLVLLVLFVATPSRVTESHSHWRSTSFISSLCRYGSPCWPRPARTSANQVVINVGDQRAEFDVTTVDARIPVRCCAVRWVPVFGPGPTSPASSRPARARYVAGESMPAWRGRSGTPSCPGERSGAVRRPWTSHGRVGPCAAPGSWGEPRRHTDQQCAGLGGLRDSDRGWPTRRLVVPRFCMQSEYVTGRRRSK